MIKAEQPSGIDLKTKLLKLKLLLIKLLVENNDLWLDDPKAFKYEQQVLGRTNYQKAWREEQYFFFPMR